MVDSHTLALFVATVLALMLSPGPNMAFLLSHVVSHGVAGGLAVAAGILVADIALTVLTATGVAAVVAAWPPFFDGLRYVGAAYLLWLAVQMLRAPSGDRAGPTAERTWRGIAWRAMVNSLLNPKALLFFVLFLPQFTQASRGDVGTQLLILGSVLTLMALVFHVLLSLIGSAVTQRLGRHAWATRGSAWLLPSVFVGLAVRLIWLQRPQ